MQIKLHCPALKIVTLVLVAALLPGSAFAQFKDQHSLEALVTALKQPISAQSIKEARDFDDKLMSEGKLDGGAVYLVTDERSTLVNKLVARLLGGLAQNSQQWVVRVLDTNPPVANAFVTGGKYIYVFTGLIKEARSEDELAFVLSHELGHSLLKHKERRKEDATATIAGIAALAALLSKKHSENFTNVAKIVTTSYSRGDEEEADAIAVAIARRAGYDPLRGADFFTRNKAKEDSNQKTNQQLLASARQTAQQAQVTCAQLTQQYNSSWQYQSPANANRVNAVCRDAENRRLNYNQLLQQYTATSLEEQRDMFFRTHPPDQQRIAAIAALTDYAYGRREVSSLARYEQSYRVVLALQQVGSVLSRPATSVGGVVGIVDTAASPSSSMDEVIARIVKGDFQPDSGMSIVAPNTAENGSVVPFFVNLDAPIGAGDRLVVVVNDTHVAYVATPLGSTSVSQLGGRVKLPSGSGTIRAAVLDSKGMIRSALKSMSVTVGVQSFDNGESAQNSPTFQHKALSSPGSTEMKVLIDYPSSASSFIESVKTEFLDGGVAISFTPVASKNPFVSFKANQSGSPSYKIGVTDNRGRTSTADGQVY